MTSCLKDTTTKEVRTVKVIPRFLFLLPLNFLTTQVNEDEDSIDIIYCLNELRGSSEVTFADPVAHYAFCLSVDSVFLLCHADSRGWCVCNRNCVLLVLQQNATNKDILQGLFPGACVTEDNDIVAMEGGNGHLLAHVFLNEVSQVSSLYCSTSLTCRSNLTLSLSFTNKITR